MKKWYYWLVFAGIWLIGGILNCVEGTSIVPTLPPCTIFLILALSQWICDKRGEKGKKFFRYICIVGTVFCVVVCLFVLALFTFIKR